MSTSDIADEQSQSEYYNTRWSSEQFRPNALELHRLIEILKALQDTKIDFSGKRIRLCELGCGRGWLASHLANFADVTAIDRSTEAIHRARKMWPNIDFRAAKIQNYRTQTSYNLVVSSEVIEHIQDKLGFVETVRSILKPGGYIILTTPNKKLYSHYYKSDAELQPVEDWVTPKDLRSLFNGGFRILRHETFLFDYFYTGIFRIISAPKFISLCRLFGLNPLRMWLNKKLHLGLHQILLAQRI